MGEQRPVLRDQPHPPSFGREHPALIRHDATIEQDSPESGPSKPANIRSNVVLPQPDGPITAWRHPDATVRSTASSAVTAGGPANTFVTPRTSSVVIDAPATCAGLRSSAPRRDNTAVGRLAINTMAAAYGAASA